MYYFNIMGVFSGDLLFDWSVFSIDNLLFLHWERFPKSVRKIGCQEVYIEIVMYAFYTQDFQPEFSVVWY